MSGLFQNSATLQQNEAGNIQFIEYIQTLGLRTFTSNDKPAFVQLKSETSSLSLSKFEF